MANKFLDDVGLAHLWEKSKETFATKEELQNISVNGADNVLLVEAHEDNTLSHTYDEIGEAIFSGKIIAINYFGVHLYYSHIDITQDDVPLVFCIDAVTAYNTEHELATESISMYLLVKQDNTYSAVYGENLYKTDVANEVAKDNVNPVSSGAVYEALQNISLESSGALVVTGRFDEDFTKISNLSATYDEMKSVISSGGSVILKAFSLYEDNAELSYIFQVCEICDADVYGEAIIFDTFIDIYRVQGSISKGETEITLEATEPDTTPTENSTNLITSGGVYNAIEEAKEELQEAINNIPSGGGEDEVVWVNCIFDFTTMQVIHISHTYEELAPLIGKKVIKIVFDYGFGMCIGELCVKNGIYDVLIAQLMLRSDLGAGNGLYFISLDLYADNSTNIEIRIVESIVLGG